MILAYLKLMRISALPTLWSNTLTAFWLGFFAWTGSVFPPGAGFLPILSVLLASTFLYLAGMVLNDFFDARIDAVERPERVIPSGRISRMSAGLFGLALLVCGWICVVACYQLHWNPLLYQTALALTAGIVGYNAFFKRIPFLGPLVMGACRLFNIFFVLVFTGDVYRWSQLCPVQFGNFHWRLAYPWIVAIYVTVLTILSNYEAKSPRIRRLVGFGLSMLIPLDSLICLIFLGPGYAAAILCLYMLALPLRRIVSMT